MIHTSNFTTHLMARACAALLLAPALLHAAPFSSADAPKPGEPTDQKARKTFADAIQFERHRDLRAAIDEFRKANKQDGGHCGECVKRAYKLAMEINDFKNAEDSARDMFTQAPTTDEKAVAHFHLAMALQRQGIYGKKDKCFSESCDEFKAALDAEPHLRGCALCLWRFARLSAPGRRGAQGVCGAFLDRDKSNATFATRAERYVERLELARARMAPPFALTTIDGRRISMDGLVGKVVLIDFWATWCGPCREALPHLRDVAQKFQGQPFVVLSVSLDSDDAKWKEFVSKNGMTWLQYRDGRWTGPIATEFDVKAIPATFSIDADGVLEDQHVGDADIEGRLKKMIAHAVGSKNQQSGACARAALGSGN